jgi:hypothetical protein
MDLCTKYFYFASFERCIIYLSCQFSSPDRSGVKVV